MDNIDFAKELAGVESSVKSAHKRLDDMNKLIESIRDVIAEVRYLREDVNKLSTDVENVKNRPTKFWDKLIGALIGAIGTGLVGAGLALIIK